AASVVSRRNAACRYQQDRPPRAGRPRRRIAGRNHGNGRMKALVLREHGETGLKLETDFPDPVPGEGDVVLRVRATSLNYHDVFTRRGMPGIMIPLPAIL